MTTSCNLWSFLNEALISSVIGGVVAGLIVGFSLYVWTGARSQRASLFHIKRILRQDIDFNLAVIEGIKLHLKTGRLTSYDRIANYPLKMSSIRVANNEVYIRVMKPDMAILVTTLLEIGDQLNNDFNEIKSSFATPRQGVYFKQIVDQFPGSLIVVEVAMRSLNGELDI